MNHTQWMIKKLKKKIHQLRNILAAQSCGLQLNPHYNKSAPNTSNHYPTKTNKKHKLLNTIPATLYAIELN